MIRIGVTPSFSENGKQICCNLDYLDGVRRTGALPLLLPPLTDSETAASVLDGLDGLLVSGGADIHPATYGEELLPCCGETCPERDLMELLLLQEALKRDMPILGICRGHEMLNCVLGGTLYQDIAEQYARILRHPVYERPRDQVHGVNLEPGSLIARITGKTSLRVNSRHHQAIGKLGRGLSVNARAEDGLTEGIELPGKRFVLGVQWHPETLADYAPEEQAIFDAFVAACGHA